MKPLVLRIQAKDEGAEAALTRLLASTKKAGGQIKDSFSTGAAAQHFKATFEGIETPKALHVTETLLKRARVEADKTGRGVRAAFNEADRAAKPVNQDLADMQKRLKAMGDQAAALRGQFKEGLGGAQDALESINGLMELQTFNDVADRLRGVGGSAKALYDQFDQAGQAGREMGRDLRRAFADPGQADKWIETAKKLKREYEGLFSGNEVSEAITNLNRFGVATEDNVKRVLSMTAANPSLSVGQVSETYGEFKKAALGGKHYFGSTEELRSQLGIDPQELVPFGAQVDKNNKLLGETKAQAEAAQKAMDAYADSNKRYQDVAKRASDAQSKLTAEMDTFKGSIGDIINEWKNLVAGGVLPLAEGLNQLPPLVKTGVAAMATIAPAAAEVGAGALEMGAYFKLAGGDLGKLGTTAAAVLTGPAGILVALTAVGGATILIAKSAVDAEKAMQQAKAAEASLVDTQQRALQTRGRDQMQGMDADAIVELARVEKTTGEQRAKITDGLIVKRGQLDQAERNLAAGIEANNRQEIKISQERIAGLNKEIETLEIWRELFDRVTKAEVDGAKQVEAANQAAHSAAQERFAAYEKKAGRGGFNSSQEQLNELNAIVPFLDQGSDIRDEAEGKRKAKRKDTLKEQIKDLQDSLAEEKAVRDVAWSEEEAALKSQLAIAKQLDKEGVEERIRIYGALAAGKAKQDQAANKKTKDTASNSLLEASKVDVNARTYDRGTGQAVDAYDAAIQRVKAWQTENAKLIAQFPELGQKGKVAIEQLDLQKAQADVARMSTNFTKLQQDIKLAGDQAVTTADKIAANEKAQKDVTQALGAKKISKEQAEQLRGPLTESGKDLDRQLDQENLQHQQQMTGLRQQAAETELAIAESLADGTIRSNDRIFLATAKLFEFKKQQIADERDAAIAAGQDKLQAEERYATEMANMERQRTADILAEAKKQGDARRQELQGIIDANRPEEKKGLTFGLSDSASFSSFGLSDEEYRKRKETKRAELELGKLDSAERFRQANPDAVAKVQKIDYDRRLQTADPSGILRSVNGKMAESQAKATGGNTTVNNNHTANIIINQEGRSGRTVRATTDEDIVRAVKRELEVRAHWNGGSGATGGGTVGMLWPLHSPQVQDQMNGVTPAPIPMLRLAAALNVCLLFVREEASDIPASALVGSETVPAETQMVNVARGDWEREAYLDLRAVWAVALPQQALAIPHDRRHTGKLAPAPARLDHYLWRLFGSLN